MTSFRFLALFLTPVLCQVAWAQGLRTTAPPVALTPSAAPQTQDARAADYIVAVVNSEPITNLQVSSQVARIRRLMGAQRRPVPDTPANKETIKALTSRRQGATLVLPLSILDRIVVFLYLEGEPEQLTMRLPELQRLVGKASMAFEILILRNKILMT